MRHLFSRGPSPPRRASFDVLPSQQEDPPLATPSDPALVNSSPNNNSIDGLVSNLTSNTASPQNYPPPPFMNALAHPNPNESNSAPATPASLHTTTGGGPNPSSTGSPPSNNTTNVLLSLLSTVSGTANSTPMNVAPPLMPVMLPQPPQQHQPVQLVPTQVPTPPGSSNAQRTNTVQSPSSSDPGKLLLDQLMSGYVFAASFLLIQFCEPFPIVSSPFLTSLTSALLPSQTILSLPRHFLNQHRRLFPPLLLSYCLISLRNNNLHGLR